MTNEQATLEKQKRQIERAIQKAKKQLKDLKIKQEAIDSELFLLERGFKLGETLLITETTQKHSWYFTKLPLNTPIQIVGMVQDKDKSDNDFFMLIAWDTGKESLWMSKELESILKASRVSE